MTDYTLIESIVIFSLCLTIEMSVAPTSNIAVVPAIVNNPRTAPDTPISVWMRSAWLLCSRLRLKFDGTRAKTRFRLSAKRTSPFKSAGASVQSTTDSRRVRISGSNAGYTTFRGSVKSTGYPLHSPVSSSLPLPCVTVCHHISTGLLKGKPSFCSGTADRYVATWQRLSISITVRQQVTSLHLRFRDSDLDRDWFLSWRQLALRHCYLTDTTGSIISGAHEISNSATDYVEERVPWCRARTTKRMS
jgi:hypothetical protein